ncbi:trypsin-like serine protease [Streptomyces sp. NPDC048389]|uniref:trypsin-like serine protease n=1 Tax=Streptomyces sp. NPDC048389 TaxID=3154622 RepID=UPI003454BD9E
MTIGDTRSCSGALVGPQWVLTASSCFTADGSEALESGAPPTKTTAVVGRNSSTNTTGHTSTVSQLLPYWDRDLVLAKLTTPATGITPVTLAVSAPTAGESVSVLGYGRTSTQWHPDQPHTASYITGATTAASVDLSGATEADTICKGDAGGPIVRTVDGVPQLVAITSKAWQGGCFGQDEAEARHDAVATLVDNVTVPAPDTTGNVAHVMAIGADSKVYGADGNYSSGSWTSFKRAAEDTTRKIAATTTNGTQRLYTVSDTGQLLHTSSSYVTGPWSKPTPLPGAEDIVKVAAVGIGNVVHLYAVKTDGKLYGADMNYATGSWKGFSYISGGDSLSDVAATATGNIVRLYVVGTGGKVFTKSGNYDTNSWGPWGTVPGPGLGNKQVAATVIGNNVHLYVLASDSVIYGTDADYTAGTWSSYAKVPGNSSIKRISATDTGNSVHLFAVAGNDEIYNANGNYTTGTWSTFKNVPGNTGIKEIATSSSS